MECHRVGKPNIDVFSSRKMTGGSADARGVQQAVMGKLGATLLCGVNAVKEGDFIMINERQVSTIVCAMLLHDGNARIPENPDGNTNEALVEVVSMWRGLRTSGTGTY